MTNVAYYRKSHAKKKWLMPLITSVLGALLGVVSKAGDIAHQGTISGNVLFAFGSVTSGFFIWIVACTIISIHSETATLAAINVFIFLGSMLFTYYLYSYYVVGYLVIRVVKFWAVALIPSAALGAVVYRIRTNMLLQRAVLIIISLIMLVDIFYWQGGAPVAIIIDIILYVILVVSLKRSRVQRA